MPTLDDLTPAIRRSEAEQAALATERIGLGRLVDSTGTDRVTDYLIAEDLEAASLDNLATYDALSRYPEALRSAGIAQPRCDVLVGDDDHGAPLVISAYGSWFGRTVATFTCECQAGR